MSATTGDKVSRIYGNFRGVDFRSEETNIVRSPDSLNVWKDYRISDSIRTRPGMVLKESFDGRRINGIYFYRGNMIVHEGDHLSRLYIVKNGEKILLWDNIIGAGGANNAFTHDNIWYFKCGSDFLQYDGTEIKRVEPYVPTTTIGRSPAGSGTVHEAVNLATGYRINSFLADGTYEYHLDTDGISEYYPVEITVDGEPLNEGNIERVDYENGIIKLKEHELPQSPGNGQDNVQIKFYKAFESLFNSVKDVQSFDNRIFFSSKYKNAVMYSVLDDPTYIPEPNSFNDGGDDAVRVSNMVVGYNALWIFKEESEGITDVFYHTPVTDDVHGRIYPSSHAGLNLGSVGQAINFNGDVVFFSHRGMEGISVDSDSGCKAVHRSSMVDSRMITDKLYESILSVNWEGYLLTFVGNKVFLADSRAVFTNEGHREYEFFYWELEKEITAAKVYEGDLYLGTEDGCVYTLTDNECHVESYFTTAKDKFDAENKLKTTNKRGCIIEAEGDFDVYVKTESSGYELAGQYTGVEDHIVCRIKKKKFKDIQLKFHSKTRFSLETATLECFVGGYIKR